MPVTVVLLIGGSTSGGTAESLLSIVTNQRERFKQRNTELEAVSVTLMPYVLGITKQSVYLFLVQYGYTCSVKSFRGKDLQFVVRKPK